MKQSIQLAEFVSAEVTTTKTGTPAKKINYKWLDGKEPTKVVAVQYLIGTIPTAELLKTLEDGDQFVIVKEQTPDGKFWNVKEFRTAEGYTPRENKEWNPRGYNKNNSSKGSRYDNLGNQIGNTITNAVNSLGVGKTIEEYKNRAREFIQVGNELRAEEEALRSGSKPQETIKEEPPIELSQDETPW